MLTSVRVKCSDKKGNKVPHSLCATRRSYVDMSDSSERSMGHKCNRDLHSWNAVFSSKKGNYKENVMKVLMGPHLTRPTG